MSSDSELMLPCHRIIIVKVKYTANGARAIQLKTTHFTFSKPKAESEMHGAPAPQGGSHMYCTWLGLLLVLALSSYKLATTVQLQSYHPSVVNKNRLIIIIYRRKKGSERSSTSLSRLHNMYLLCKLKKK